MQDETKEFCISTPIDDNYIKVISPAVFQVHTGTDETLLTLDQIKEFHAKLGRMIDATESTQNRTG